MLLAQKDEVLLNTKNYLRAKLMRWITRPPPRRDPVHLLRDPVHVGQMGTHRLAAPRGLVFDHPPPGQSEDATHGGKNRRYRCRHSIKPHAGTLTAAPHRTTPLQEADLTHLHSFFFE